MSSIVDDSQQASLVHNIEQIQHVSPKGALSYSFGLALSNSFSKLPILDENLSWDKHENVNIVDSYPPLIALVVTIPRTGNNSSKPISSKEKSL